MIVFPNAKINLGLHVVEKRSDGFHNIETIFCPVPCCDALECIRNNEPSDNKIVFSQSGLPVAGEQKDNLCIKAFELLDKKFSLPPVKMHLHKIIPMGAGLGGGSSDAAFTLKLLNNLFDLNLDKAQLKKYAAQLGSDCSFFIENIPSIAKGRGDELESQNVSLKGNFFLIVKPAIHVETAAAYKMIKPKTPIKSLKQIIQLPITDWKELLKNDFEESVFNEYSEIKEIKDKMYQQRAIYSSMSGSGSAVYGIFSEKIYDKTEFMNCTVLEGVLT
jgi:4-diphosphocytidyl-2-C-methyl-D-erythritol kinase